MGPQRGVASICDVHGVAAEGASPIASIACAGWSPGPVHDATADICGSRHARSASETGNINPASIEKKITNKTKAIMVVHWGGLPVDLDEINAIAQAANLKLIEDAAHACGAEYKGRKIGEHSDFVCFSFQAIKHIITVDGGALLCKSEGDYRRGKLLRWYGIDRESPRADFRCEADIVEWGYKFHMNDVAATIGLVQLPHLDPLLAQRRELAAFYDKALSTVPGVRLCQWPRNRLSAFWLYTLFVENREDFMRVLFSGCRKKDIRVSDRCPSQNGGCPSGNESGKRSLILSCACCDDRSCGILDTCSSFSCSVALYHCSLMAHAIGLGCCFNGFLVSAVNHNPKIKRWLNIPADHRCYSDMVLGYPKIKYPGLVQRQPPKVIWR